MTHKGKQYAYQRIIGLSALELLLKPKHYTALLRCHSGVSQCSNGIRDLTKPTHSEMCVYERVTNTLLCTTGW